MNQRTMNDVLTGLADDGYVTADEIERARGRLGDLQSDTAWYIQGVMGCGGWIAAVLLSLFVGFLLGDILFDGASGGEAMFLGALIIGGTVFLRRMIDNMAVHQFALAWHIAGQLLFLFGMVELADWTGDFALFYFVMILVEIAMIIVYPDTLLRFMAGLAIAACLNGIAIDLEVPVMVSFAAILLAAATTYIWGGFVSVRTVINLRPVVRPAAYALVIGLYGTIVHELTANRSIYTPEGPATIPALTSTALALMVLFVVWRALRAYDVPAGSPVAVGAFGFVILFAFPSLLAPGLMASVLVILLGFRNRNTILITLGYLSLIGFVSEFYYSLDTTLLVKSLIMTASGAVMLGGWAALRRALPPGPDESRARKIGQIAKKEAAA